MAEQRPIDANLLLHEIGNYSLQVACNKSDGRLEIMTKVTQAVQDHAAKCIDAAPTIDPETIPIVRQLRAELARVTAERDAALRELRSIQTHTRSLRDYVDDEIHPVVDYSIYLNLREAVDTIDSWQHITPDGAIKEATP